MKVASSSAVRSLLDASPYRSDPRPTEHGPIPATTVMFDTTPIDTTVTFDRLFAGPLPDDRRYRLDAGFVS